MLDNILPIEDADVSNELARNFRKRKIEILTSTMVEKAVVKGSKVEIKTERNWWRKTGNIAIEYEYREKPSGIDKTESKWWFHILELDGKEHCMLVFRVSRLKKIVKKYKKTHTKNIGDYRASKCVVIPLKELFTEGCISIKYMSEKNLLREMRETINDLVKEKNDAIKVASDKDSKIKHLLIQLEQANSDVQSMGSKIADLQEKLNKKDTIKRTINKKIDEILEKKDENSVDIDD